MARDPEKARARSRRYRANKIPETRHVADRRANLKRYGITPADYDALLAKQGGGCAMCGSKTPGGRGRFHIDHDHETKKVRGLLCNLCNVGIGYLRHDAEILLAAVDYLAQPPAQFPESS